MARAAQAPLQSQAAPTPALLSIPPPTLSLPHRVFSCVPLTALYPVSLVPKSTSHEGLRAQKQTLKSLVFFSNHAKNQTL